MKKTDSGDCRFVGIGCCMRGPGEVLALWGKGRGVADFEVVT